MNPIARYKRWKLWRDAAKAWRAAGLGTMRYVWHVGGARIEFSAPDAKDLRDLQKVVSHFADVLQELLDRKITVEPDFEG